jgi:hypothetical protein
MNCQLVHQSQLGGANNEKEIQQKQTCEYFVGVGKGRVGCKREIYLF